MEEYAQLYKLIKKIQNIFNKIKLKQFADCNDILNFKGNVLYDYLKEDLTIIISTNNIDTDIQYWLNNYKMFIKE